MKINNRAINDKPLPVTICPLNGKKLLHINKILSLPVDRLGKEGDIFFMYHNFIIIVKADQKIKFNLNQFMKIRITKIMPKFALGVLVK